MDQNRCLSRITQHATAQYFGDGKHRFYLEYRCGRPSIASNATICMSCISKSGSTHAQHSRSFPHGKINEFIPPASHIYGGSWYMAGIKKWGEPQQGAIELAIQFQEEARGKYIVPPQGPQLEKPVKAVSIQSPVEMPPRKKTTEETVKKIRKPKVGVEPSSSTEDAPVKKPRLKKKPVAGDAIVGAPDVSSPTDAIAMLAAPAPAAAPTIAPAEAKVPRKLKKKPQVGQDVLPLHKEVVLPTHMEVSMDEVDVRDYTKEYVRVSLFEYNHTT